MEEFIGQSRFLNNASYENLIILFLQECENLKDFDKKPESISQIIFLCTEILIINHDRINLVWKNFTIVLGVLINIEKNRNIEMMNNLDDKLKKVCEKVNNTKKKNQNKKLFLTTFCKYCLFKLCLLFLHISDDLFMYDILLQEALKCLNDCSVELLICIFQQIQEFLHSDFILEK